MSRAPEGDCETSFCYLWESIYKRALNGKRGQALFRELEKALLALPADMFGKKRLIANSFTTQSGEVCTLGALAKARGVEVKVDPDEDHFDDFDESASRFAERELGVARTLAWSIMNENDEQTYRMSPEQRYEHMLDWVRKRIKAQKTP